MSIAAHVRSHYEELCLTIRDQCNHDLGKYAEDMLTSSVTIENACLDHFPDFPRDRQQGIFNGPRGYQPSKDTKLAVIKDYSRILPCIMPKDDAYTASILWHDDLHSDNIFVNENCPTEITVIIDWQDVHLSRLFFMRMIHLLSGMMGRFWITSRSLYCLLTLRSWLQMTKTRRELYSRRKEYGLYTRSSFENKLQICCACYDTARPCSVGL
jgi:hypothetical protein